METVPVPQAPRKKNTALVHALALVCGGLAGLATTGVQAQESVLHGLGWITERPGSTLESGSSARNTGNRATGEVMAGGGKATVGAGIAGSAELIATSQANMIGLSALDTRNTQVSVLQNQVSGFVRAIGGAASANSVLLSGGQGRRPLADSRIQIQNNQASRIEAHGAKASVALGAGSLQLPGRATANGLLADESDLRRLRADVTGNRAEGVASLGGAAIANGSTLARTPVDDLQITQTDNRARDVRAGGGSASVGWGAIASAQLSGVAAANALTAANSRLEGARLLQQGNQAESITATGGSALANSLNLADYQGAALRQYSAQIANNRATRVDADGGSGSVLGGALADVQMAAVALANSISVQGGSVEGSTRHTVSGNVADGVRANGGAAVANSVWLSKATTRATSVVIQDNKADNVATTGFQGSAAGGLIASGEQNAMALVNSLGVLGSEVDAGRVDILGNQASGLSSRGGKLVANAVSVEKGDGGASRLSARTTVQDNSARQVSTGAASGAVAGGLASTDQNARAAVNAVVLHQNARADGGSTLQVTGNRASNVRAPGGTALVNALGVYRDSQLSGSPVTLADNQASDVTAGGGSGQAMGAGSAKNGILVANGLYLEGEGGARLASSPLTVRGNTARQLQADGGRVNANALAVNGQGDVQASPVTLTGNQASDVRSSGKEGTLFGKAVSGGVGQAYANAVQVLGQLRGSSLALADNMAGQVRGDQALALANSVLLDENATLEGSSVSLRGNQAQGVQAQGGHVAAANSLVNEGRISGAQIGIDGNRATVQADGGDAIANTVRNRGSMAGSRVTISGNQGQVARKGTANSVDNGGTLAGGQITILGNQGSAQDGGTVNSFVNSGRATGNVHIAGNTGSARGNGSLANSVRNTGNLAANITILGNQGTASGGGVVNSVVNRGNLSGAVAIVGNRGTASNGGTVNSLVNTGTMAGKVTIAGNQGSAGMGGTANSVINRGVITGSVTIVGNNARAGMGTTTASVRNVGVLAGSAGVAGGAPWAASVGKTITLPSTGVVNRSVTVGPAVTVLNM
ncbi:beta strand repeat-containing protein [Pseudacidovorax sp. NFM-22]|uniref:beta strand repeat-containing protein n=1 Tax=Pseudacidovorax sp. NFM-22 TaxID=2744469 RepID=UPI001F311166|nr:hypothetical protein [Pseudacidovorax sp. NFM-22]